MCIHDIVLRLYGCFDNLIIAYTIHYQTYKLNITLEVGVSVPPGKGAFISLRAHMFDDRSKTKYCKAPSSPADFELLENYNYSFPACLKDCLLRDIAETCQCIDNTVRPPPILTSPCATFTGCAVWLQV